MIPWALMTSAVIPIGWLIVVKVVPVVLLRMNPGVLVPEVNWPTMLPLSLIPKALMAPAGVVRICNEPPLGRKKAFVPLPPTTSPAVLIPKAVWPAPVFNWVNVPVRGLPEKLVKVGIPFTSTVVPMTWPLLLIPFTLEPVAVPVSGEKSKLVNV